MTHTFTRHGHTYACRLVREGWPPFPGRTGPATWVISTPAGDVHGPLLAGDELEAGNLAAFEAECVRQVRVER